MESDFEFFVTLLGRDFTTDRQTATEWSGVKFWSEPVGKNSDKVRQYFMIYQKNIHSAGVGVNSYHTG